MRERWDSVNGLKPLVLTVVFVVAIVIELVGGIDGLSAGARAVVYAGLVGGVWEIAPRAVDRVRRPGVTD